MIQENGQLRIYGEGTISSPGESDFCLRENVPKAGFGVAEILATPYHIDRYQDHYFVVDSYGELYRSVKELRKILEESTQKAPIR